MDMFSAPFEYNAFDNLPLSLSVPNTFQANMPSKLKKTSFSLLENDQMAHQNFKTLFAKVEKQVKQFRRK